MRNPFLCKMVQLSIKLLVGNTLGVSPPENIDGCKNKSKSEENGPASGACEYLMSWCTNGVHNGSYTNKYESLD